MKERMTNELRVAFTKGQSIALKYSDSTLRLQHVMYGVLTTENMIYEIVKSKVLDFDTMVNDLNEINKRLSDSGKDEISTILPFESDLQDVIKESISRKKSEDYITVELFFMVAIEKDNAISKLFKDYGLTKTFVAKKIKQLSAPQNVNSFYSDVNNNNNNDWSKDKNPNPR
jgi:ATP-dependent Clp protease ATP-binding subunit ClpA